MTGYDTCKFPGAIFGYNNDSVLLTLKSVGSS